MNDLIFSDLHIHSHDLLPFGFRQVYTFVNRKTVPPLFKIESIPNTQLKFVIANAVGDSIVTNLYLGGGFSSVKKQLKKIIKHCKKINAIIYENPGSIKEGLESDCPIVLLAVEGGDFINKRIERIKELHKLGVRALTIVHSEDNCIGSSILNLSKLLTKKGHFPSKKDKGLTEFGREVIQELNSLGIIIDLAHASHKTLIDVCEISSSSVIASHTGARSLQQNFPRYLSDEEIKAIVKTGGIIGVWPFYWQSVGAKTLDILIEHFRYIKELVGSEHLGFGSDINGIPGITEGFSYPDTLYSLPEKLTTAGFEQKEIKQLLGENILNLLNTSSN